MTQGVIQLCSTGPIIVRHAARAVRAPFHGKAVVAKMNIGVVVFIIGQVHQGVYSHFHAFKVGKRIGAPQTDGLCRMG